MCYLEFPAIAFGSLFNVRVRVDVAVMALAVQRRKRGSMRRIVVQRARAVEKALRERRVLVQALAQALVASIRVLMVGVLVVVDTVGSIRRQLGLLVVNVWQIIVAIVVVL